MATIDDLPGESIADMSVDEGIELLRQIRLSRRTPKKTTKRRAQNRAARKPKKTKPSDLTAAQAQQLLDLLEDE
jgi:hypothetical protein